MSATLAAFSLYLVATVGIGLWAARRGKDDEEDYFLGGRALSGVAMALSAVSSGRSAWLVLGASGFAWANGLSALWLFPGYIVAEAWMFVGMGPRLRERSIECDAITVPEVLGKLPLGRNFVRGHSRLPVQGVAGAIVVLFLTAYVSAQLAAGAKTLEFAAAVDGIELEGETWGLAITAAIVLAYTLLGGYRAVVITDVVQALLMLAGLVVLPLVATLHIGGFGVLAERLGETGPDLLGDYGGAAAFFGGLSIGFGSFGQPHILVRHMSLGDPSTARRALVAGTAWNVVMAGGALLMGLVGRALYPALESLAEMDPESVFVTLAGDMTARYAFDGALGILVAALFAAVMSTCDSQLLVVASSVLRDLFQRRLPLPEEGADAQAAVRAPRGRWAGRVAVAVTLAAAVLLHLGDLPQVHVFVLLAWSGLGAAFGPALLLALYDERTTMCGVLASMLIGLVGILLVHWRLPEGEHVSWHLAVVFGLALLVGRSLRARVPEADRLR